MGLVVILLPFRFLNFFSLPPDARSFRVQRATPAPFPSRLIFWKSALRGSLSDEAMIRVRVWNDFRSSLCLFFFMRHMCPHFCLRFGRLARVSRKKLLFFFGFLERRDGIQFLSDEEKRLNETIYCFLNLCKKAFQKNIKNSFKLKNL